MDQKENKVIAQKENKVIAQKENKVIDQKEMSDIFNTANIHLLENRYDESLKLYSLLKYDNNIENPGLTHNIGLNYLVKYQFDKAIELFEENNTKYPNYIVSYLTIVNCYIFKKDILKAKHHAEQLLEKFPMYPQIYFILNQIYNIVGDENLATECVKKGLEITRNIKHAKETKHYVQCYYENYTETIYYMI